MPDLFRLKGESYEKEIYIFSKYPIPVQISEAASPCRRSASCFHNTVYSVFRTRRKILIFYRKPGFYRSLCRYPFPSFSGKPDLSIFKRYLELLFGSSLLSPLFLSQFELGFCCLLIVVLGCCLVDAWCAWSAWWQQPHIVVIGQFY